MMAGCASPNSPRGARLMTSRPLLSMVLLAASTPTTELTLVTAASAITASAAARCNAAMRVNDTSGAACTRICSWPVLWVGNSDFGMAQYSSAVSTSVASATSSVAPWRASTQPRPRS